MPSYYEVLKLDSNASVEVIEAAIDDQYNQFRRLVNHHDPNVVEQANRALRQLEDIRSTLTNPEKRALYDQTHIGGLVDPKAILRSVSPGLGAVTPLPSQTASQDDPRVYAWKCSQCGTANLLGSKTCSNCGNILARDCPNGCGNMVRLQEKYCSKCGKSVEEGLAKMQLEFEQAQKRFCDELRMEIQSIRDEIDRLSRLANNLPWLGSSKWNQLPGQTVSSRFLSGCAFNVLFWTLLAFGFAVAVLLHLLTVNTSSDAQRAFLLSCGATVIGIVGYLVLRGKARYKARLILSEVANQREEEIRRIERRLQVEQSKQFDPMSPMPYSPTTGE